ncbi:AN1-type zinc finger protein 2A isoform X2 [Parasteatoda tepidariorum]|uniref:AN1-type zinc finger protein 2A isoform X2 n=1 Tax=Parasteatoda tepidariorum TaxID=114398 RepID=UPI0039BC9542
MEFPNLGSHCFEKSCNRLDFLPVKCDACSNVFCYDHFQYNKHSCNKGYQKDVQVPVCPLCNSPVPSKRGEQPDIAVSEHIDRDCQADPAIAKRKVYTSKCSVKGCKLKEIVRINCNVCNKNYCLKHRHPDDHKCSEQKVVSPAQAAGAAALARAQNTRKPIFQWFSSQSASTDHRRNVAPLPEVSVTTAVQGSMTEDEALALALHKSLNENAPKNIQEQEDMLLAQALAQCDDSQRRQTPKEKNCCLS